MYLQVEVSFTKEKNQGLWERKTVGTEFIEEVCPEVLLPSKYKYLK